MSHPFFQGARRPRVLAHRGLLAPGLSEEGIAENSVAAIAAAQAAGVEFIESDCRLTADGVVVLWHDETLARVAGDRRVLTEVTARELAEIMAPRGGLAVLQDVLRDFPETRFNIDVKADAAAVPAGRIAAEHWDRVLLTSFAAERRLAALHAAGEPRPATSADAAIVRALVPAVTLRARKRVARLLEGVDALQVPERHRGMRVVTPRLVSAAHENGVEVHVWTINDPARMRSLIALGADGITTDRADLALSTLQD
jgi:glycerophosphoryl diester phosphodiesterase